MNSQSPSLAPRSPARPRWASVPSGLSGQQPSSHWNDLGNAWGYVAYIISGVVFWGGIGWLIDQAAGWYPVATVIGALLGNAAGIYLIYVRALGGRK